MAQTRLVGLSPCLRSPAKSILIKGPATVRKFITGSFVSFIDKLPFQDGEDTMSIDGEGAADSPSTVFSDDDPPLIEAEVTDTEEQSEKWVSESEAPEKPLKVRSEKALKRQLSSAVNFCPIHVHGLLLMYIYHRNRYGPQTSRMILEK